MRHGRSLADDEGVHEGRYDSPLTKIGHVQSHTRAQEFRKRGLKFDVIISSPLQRAQSTAQAFEKALRVPVELDEDWMEMDNGPLAGMKREVAAVKYPKPAFRNLYEPICGTGESAWELYCRAARAVEKIIWRGAGKYLVVAHGGILNAAMRTIMGIPPRGDKPDVVFGFGDLGYARMEYRPERHVWRLLEFSNGLPPVN
jgi:2,3-bisphosphoglycerate-dependent phosphoglycerate mutase